MPTNVKSASKDNGTEFYEHQTITQKLNTLFFFANPYSSWQRGLNEYTNGLIRQYIPKKQTFNKYNDEQIATFQKKIIIDQEKNLTLTHQKINSLIASTKVQSNRRYFEKLILSLNPEKLIY